MDIEFIRNFPESEKKYVISIVNKIRSNVFEKKWECLYNDCNHTAINSHLLQKNGILNNISKENHIYQFSYKATQRKGNSFHRIGINNVLSQTLFCKEHDNFIFNHIENGKLDVNNYNTQLLFSYRAFCNELHLKRIAIEYFKRLYNSKTLDFFIEKTNFHTLKNTHQLGLNDCYYYKNEVEHDLNSSSQSFVFKTFEYPLIKICASAAFTPIDKNVDLYSKLPFENIVINIFPYKEKTIIIIGYHKKHNNKWILNYLNSWDKLDMLNLQLKISDLLATRIDTFCISPEIYENINQSKLNDFLLYWEENKYNLSQNQNFSINLFN